MSSKRWSATLLGGVLGILGACADGDDSRGSDGLVTSTTGVDASTDSGSEGGNACVPGMQSACACIGGVEGVQVCRDDGSGFDGCECPEDGGDASTTDDTDAWQINRSRSRRVSNCVIPIPRWGSDQLHKTRIRTTAPQPSQAAIACRDEPIAPSSTQRPTPRRTPLIIAPIRFSLRKAQ